MSAFQALRRSRPHGLLLLPLLAMPLGAAQGPTFEGTSQVVAVEVPVNVVGRDGEPVRGLTAEDFEVYDGGERQKITSFEVVDLKTLETRPAAAGDGSAPAARPEIPSAARRRFLLLFDLSFSSPTSVLKARVAARDFVLHGLRAEDLAAVATYSLENGPKLIVTFTPDRAQLARAIDTLGYRRALDVTAKSDPLRFMIEAPATEQMASTMDVQTGAQGQRNLDLRQEKEQVLYDYLAGIAFASARSDRSYEISRITGYSRSLSDVARALNAVQGRKQVVFFSEGFDSRLLLGRRTTDDDAEADNLSANFGEIWKVDNDQRYGNTGLQTEINRMLDEFRRADCVIQAVDIGGLRAGADIAARRGSGREALFNMAKSTGGELYENANDLSTAMGQMLRRTGVTYVLAFQPDDLKQDGAYHKLRVELKNAPRGARVVYRPGFYAPRPFKEQSPLQRLLEAASDVMGQDGSGGISTAVYAAPFAAANNRANVPVVVEVDGPTLLAGKQDAKLPVEVYIYALDAGGAVQDFVTQVFGLDLTKTEPVLRQAGMKFFGNLELPPGRYSIRTLIRNGTTGNSSLRITQLEVPAFAQGGTTILPAVFQDPAPGRWVNLRQAKKEGQGEPPYLFMLKDQPYVPTVRPALAAGQDARVVLQGYNLGEGDWKAEAKVVGADGKEVPGTLQLGEKEAGGAGKPTRMVATFRPPSLPPGDYQLRVTLTNAAGKAETSTARFTVPGAGARGSR